MKLSEASEALQRIGLSRYEALVFVNLARAGATTAGDVARVSGVNRVQTYRALEGLEARGVVEVTLDRPRRYAARAINDVFEMIAEEKRSELEKLHALRKFVPLRHVDRQRARFILVDRDSILAFLIQDEKSIRGEGETALWTNSPDFVKAHLEFFEKSWASGTAARRRLAELRGP